MRHCNIVTPFVCTLVLLMCNADIAYIGKNCTEEIIKTVMKSKSVTVKGETTTFCWSIKKLFRCKRSKLAYKRIYEAIPSTYSVPICCSGETEVNETTCINACPLGIYGGNCSNNCSCPTGDNWLEGCERYNGTCMCGPGYTGVNCSEECTQGYFGQDCKKNCSCQNSGKCNRINGDCNCTNPGWTGQFCEKECENGTYGINCENECNCPANSTCDPKDGHCTCLPGLKGKNCTDVCGDFTYGVNCGQTCSCNKNNTRHCNPVDGGCRCKSGWEGMDCSYNCGWNRYGEECSKNCTCNVDELCDPAYGNCYKSVCYSPYAVCDVDIGPCPAEINKNSSYMFSNMTLRNTLIEFCIRYKDIRNGSLCLSNTSCTCTGGANGTYCEMVPRQKIIKREQSDDNSSNILPIIAAVISISCTALCIVVAFLIVRKRMPKKGPRKTMANNMMYSLTSLQRQEMTINGNPPVADGHDNEGDEQRAEGEYDVMCRDTRQQNLPHQDSRDNTYSHIITSHHYQEDEYDVMNGGNKLNDDVTGDYMSSSPQYGRTSRVNTSANNEGLYDLTQSNSVCN